MLNLYQRDALGNFITVLSRRYRNQFNANLWELFSEYHPNKDFTISGAEYYRVLKSILYPEKMDVVFKLISTFKYDQYNPREFFSTLVYLNMCEPVGYFTLSIILNILDTFGRSEGHPFCWIDTQKKEWPNWYGASFHFNDEMGGEVSFFIQQYAVDYMTVDFSKPLLRKIYPFGDYPDEFLLRNISSDLIERDLIKEMHCPWLYTDIRRIVAVNRRILNKIVFELSGLVFQNPNGSANLFQYGTEEYL